MSLCELAADWSPFEITGAEFERVWGAKGVHGASGPGQDRRVDDLRPPSEPVRRLLACWGIRAGAAVARTAYGTNNHTLQVTDGTRRWSLRISQNLTPAQVQAEHRLLAQLAQAGLPFAVPAPVALPDGATIVDTPDGPATLCPWIPGVRPDLDQETVLERLGRAAAQLSDALRDVEPQDTPQDWEHGPIQQPPNDGTLARELTAPVRVAATHRLQQDVPDEATTMDNNSLTTSRHS